jgi:hypothetical protein
VDAGPKTGSKASVTAPQCSQRVYAFQKLPKIKGLENPVLFASRKLKEITSSSKPSVALEICNFLSPRSLAYPSGKIQLAD